MKIKEPRILGAPVHAIMNPMITEEQIEKLYEILLELMEKVASKEEVQAFLEDMRARRNMSLRDSGEGEYANNA